MRRRSPFSAFCSAMTAASLLAVFMLAGCWHGRGNVTGHLTVDGRSRTFTLHRPANAPAGELLPVVLVFHGGFGNGAGMARQLDASQEIWTFFAAYHR